MYSISATYPFVLFECKFMNSSSVWNNVNFTPFSKHCIELLVQRLGSHPRILSTWGVSVYNELHHISSVNGSFRRGAGKLLSGVFSLLVFFALKFEISFPNFSGLIYGRMQANVGYQSLGKRNKYFTPLHGRFFWYTFCMTWPFTSLCCSSLQTFGIISGWCSIWGVKTNWLKVLNLVAISVCKIKNAFSND